MEIFLHGWHMITDQRSKTIREALQTNLGAKRKSHRNAYMNHNPFGFSIFSVLFAFCFSILERHELEPD